MEQQYLLPYLTGVKNNFFQQVTILHWQVTNDVVASHMSGRRPGGEGSIFLYPESLMKWWNPFQQKQTMTLVNTFEIWSLFVFLQQPNSQTEGGHWQVQNFSTG